MYRSDALDNIRRNPVFDIIVIGGGATGIGTALDAALRGYRVLLLEKSDFTKGTSSRSTKLIHGGVRYLAQGNIFLVTEALRERGFLRKNAAHLVHNQAFIIPNYRWWEGIFYTIGLKVYDLMSGFLSLGKSLHISGEKVRVLMPGIVKKGLSGGVIYHDGRFDDSRLAMDLLHSFFEKGGTAINYFPVTSLNKDIKGKLSGVSGKDLQTGAEYRLFSSAVINATGVWVDDILRMDQPGKRKLVRPSQGIHLVINKKFLPGGYALMIPRTDDGRVLFGVPWHDHILIGTTDTPLDQALEEPVALREEVNFVLKTANSYLEQTIRREDVLSVFAGLRPLAAPGKDSSKTREISRSHRIYVSKSRLITITGGKWTTYRKMAEELVTIAARTGNLPFRKSISKNFRISGHTDNFTWTDHLSIYGSRREAILLMVKDHPSLGEKLHPELEYTGAELAWLCRSEMVVKLEDLLARRIRALFLNARAAMEIADKAAEIAGRELGWDEERMKEEVREFTAVAEKYLLK